MPKGGMYKQQLQHFYQVSFITGMMKYTTLSTVGEVVR